MQGLSSGRRPRGREERREGKRERGGLGERGREERRGEREIEDSTSYLKVWLACVSIVDDKGTHLHPHPHFPLHQTQAEHWGIPHLHILYSARSSGASYPFILYYALYLNVGKSMCVVYNGDSGVERIARSHPNLTLWTLLLP